MYHPDQYVAACIAEAGPSPMATLIKAAVDWYGYGPGSKAEGARKARSLIGAAMVALNGNPLAFQGGLNRDPAAPLYPNSPPGLDVLAVVESDAFKALFSPATRDSDLPEGYSIRETEMGSFALYGPGGFLLSDQFGSREAAATSAKLSAAKVEEHAARNLINPQGHVSLTLETPHGVENVGRFTTIADAVAYLDRAPAIDADALAAGHYAIAAPHGVGNDDEASNRAEALGFDVFYSMGSAYYTGGPAKLATWSKGYENKVAAAMAALATVEA